jgi:predicted TPR repeat methyltransferase
MQRADFWRIQHQAQDKFWLTGTSLDLLLSFYDLPRPIDQDVTEIGVGLGYCTRALANQPNRVTAIDIVEEALTPLRPIARTLLTSELQKAPLADLAICHLVFQHCDTDTVDRLLAVPLKINGIFAFQTAYLLDSNATGWDPLRVVWHSRDEVITLAKKNGLSIELEKQTETMMDGELVGSSFFKARKVNK